MFWGYAVSIVAYIINRRPPIPIGFKIPEKWQGRKVSLTHLKVFGCVSNNKIKDADKDKLKEKSKELYFHWLRVG